MSGRLHKPVKIIKKSPNPHHTTFRFGHNTPIDPNKNQEELADNFSFEYFNKSLDLALQTNLQNVLHTSLLLLPEKFTLDELFLCIAHISYSGDLRMIVGENKQKCFNIVRPQMNRFTELYKPYLIKETFEKYLECSFETGQCHQYLNHATIYHHLNQLPKSLIKTIIMRKFTRSHYYDMEEYVFKLTNRIDYKEIISDAVKSIVKYTSTVQAAKGVLTAGLFKTVNYSMRKLRKMLKR
jgi:translocator assembly and maintenance protein 41